MWILESTVYWFMNVKSIKLKGTVFVLSTIIYECLKVITHLEKTHETLFIKILLAKVQLVVHFISINNSIHKSIRII